MLKDPNDQRLRAKVKNLLERLRADPKNGIAAILDANDIEASGGWPTASFILAMKPGYTVGGAWTGELVMEEKNAGGTHGWLPREPDMHASFLISGRGIARTKNLGTIDMRRIAPTFAKILDVPLPAATAPALPVQDH
jgi:hypothetical protein